MNSGDRIQIAREVNEASRCSHPVRLSSTQLNVVTGEVTATVFKVACKDRREAVCPACSRTYGTDAWIVAATGLNGGKGVSTDVANCPRFFVTMTAPGFGAIHTVRSNGRCVQMSSYKLCEHGWPKSCGLRHASTDRLLGLPVCEDCFQYRDAVLWNAHASRLWSSTVLQTRRNLASRLGVRRADLTRSVSIHYLKVAEMQRRGLIHFHALVRLESDQCHDVAYYENHLVGAWTDAVSEVTLSNEFGRFGWGSVFEIKTLGKQNDDVRALASYLAKYVTKTAGEGLELARRFQSRSQISMLVDNPHLRRMALEAWDLATMPGCSHFNSRAHANTLGFAGQLMTKSRQYSTTLTALRHARSEYRSRASSSEFVHGAFLYAGRGYDNPRTVALAELLVNIERERRHSSRSRFVAEEGTRDRG
jgi:hypothetical protein